jgi:hypothetical protein
MQRYEFFNLDGVDTYLTRKSGMVDCVVLYKLLESRVLGDVLVLGVSPTVRS